MRTPGARLTCFIYVSQGYNPGMIIGDRLRALREEKKLSRGDIEKRTGLLRCYISAWKMGIRFLPSKHWKRCHAL
jgi:hypothetical protein